MATHAPKDPPAAEHTASSVRRAPTHQSTLQSTRTNLAFLVNPANAPVPASRRTRAFLKTARYTLRFLFWRLYRYAKYAAIGSITALVAGTAIGTVASGAAFVIAPPGILGGAVVGVLWAVAKYELRRHTRRAETNKAEAYAAEQPHLEPPPARGLYSDPTEF